MTMNKKKTQSERLLYLLFIVTLILFVIRLYNTFSIQHSLTGGIEDEGLLAIWLTKNSNFFQNHYLFFPKIENFDNKIFNLFQYNWLWYIANSYLVALFENIFSLSDEYFANLVRVNNLIFSIVSLVILYLIFLKQKISRKINFIFCFFIIFGPLIGFWSMSAKPDMAYLVFEIFAIYLIIKNINKLNLKNVLFITFVLYLSWSMKQTSIITSIAFFIYLILKKNKIIFFYCFSFLTLIIVTFIVGGETYISNLLWLNAKTNFSLLHFFKLFISSILKILPLFVLSLLILISLKKEKKIRIKNNNILLFLIIGIICSTINIILSYHVGSAPNYYFISTIYLLIFVIFNFKQIFLFNSNFNNIFNLSLIIQIILIIFVIFGVLGKTKPYHFDQVQKFKICTSNIKTPIFFSNIVYYRLPWVAGNYEKNPLIQNWFYDRQFENQDISKTPIFKFIENGAFQSLVLTNYFELKFNLKQYKLLKKCKLDQVYKIYIKK